MIILFTSISVLLVGISVASLLILNHTMNKLSDSLYSDVYQNSELILNADRDLYQAALALQTTVGGALTSAQRSTLSQEFEDNNAQALQRVSTARYNLDSVKSPFNGMKQSELLLDELRNELDHFGTTLTTWRDSGRELISQRVQSDWNPAFYSALTIHTELNEVREVLNQAEDRIDSYANQVMTEFNNLKSSLFAVYSVFLFLLVLVIFYLSRRLISLQNEMQDEKSLYQLIGETMSDFYRADRPERSHSVCVPFPCNCAWLCAEQRGAALQLYP
ncbi:hypothetical protein ACFTAO_10065 [Paenibacillus rhizoplanae]